MSRMFLVWSLLFGLALAGADWYVERERGREMVRSGEGTSAAAPSDEGVVRATEDGTPIPPPK